MKEKIEWYQEVLQIEPGSKVFFPLAKLLADNGQLNEAIFTLRQGLEKHPEFFEARLLIVDLLQSRGETNAAIAEINNLTIKLESYPSFWEAWGKSFALKGAKEAALALKLFTLFLQGKFVSWERIMQKAFDLLLKAESQMPESEKNIFQSAVNKLSLDLPSLPISFSPSPISSSTTNSASDFDFIAQIDSEINSSAVSSMTIPSGSRTASLFSVPDKTAFEVEDLNGLPVSVADNSFDNINSLELAEGSVFSQSLAALEASNAFIDAEGDSIAALENDEDDLVEPFSLRTKTMASILVDQGDYQGAIEIYQELYDNATNINVKNDLEEVIAKLNLFIAAEAEQNLIQKDIKKEQKAEADKSLAKEKAKPAITITSSVNINQSNEQSKNIVNSENKQNAEAFASEQVQNKHKLLEALELLAERLENKVS